MDRESYIEETWRTIPMVEGKTIDKILTMGSFEHGREVVGLRLVFTDGTEATLTTPDHGPVDLARSRGLYTPERRKL